MRGTRKGGGVGRGRVATISPLLVEVVLSLGLASVLSGMGSLVARVLVLGVSRPEIGSEPERLFSIGAGAGAIGPKCVPSIFHRLLSAAAFVQAQRKDVQGA